MNLTLKNIPENCEEKVKEIAMVVIERALKPKISEKQEEKFRSDINTIRKANNLEEKEI